MVSKSTFEMLLVQCFALFGKQTLVVERFVGLVVLGLGVVAATCLIQNACDIIAHSSFAESIAAIEN